MKYVYDLVEIEGMPTERIGNKASTLSVLKNRDQQLVPESWVIDSEIAKEYINSGGEYPRGFEKEISKAISYIEKRSKSYFNDNSSPLLVAIRLSQHESVEGLKHYILNIGMNDEVVAGLIKKYGRHRFAYMTYCQFIYDFSHIVLGVPKESLDKQKQAILTSEKIAEYKFLDESHLKELATLYKAVVFQETGNRFPEDPIDQLTYALEAIYDSWDSKTAKTYRKAKGIKDNGLAVIIQQMVFGNLGMSSGVGIIESRDSKNGEKGIYGEFIHEAQGPELQKRSDDILDINVMEERFPEAYKRLQEICSGLEIITKKAVKLDFVVEDGKLWIVEINTPAMSAKASVSVAADMLRNEILTPEEAINSLDGERLDQVFYPEIDERSRKKIAFNGLSASVGVVKGVLIFDYTKINEYQGNKILVADSSEALFDHTILDKFDGFIFLRGGVNSHITNYSKNAGKPCITKCKNVSANWTQREINTENGDTYKEGAEVILDANNGCVLIGEVYLNNPDIDSNLKYIISNAEQISKVETELQANNIESIEEGKNLNMDDVGLFSMSNLILSSEILPLVQDFILNLGTTKFGNLDEEIIKKLKNGIINIFQTVGDNSINIHLYENSINHILPSPDLIEEIAEQINVNASSLANYVYSFQDDNPEFGLGGARMYLKNWRFYEFQLRSIIEAVIESRKISFSNASKVTISVNKLSRLEESKALRNKFNSIVAEYSEVLDVKIKFGLVIDNVRAMFDIENIGPDFEELNLDLNRINSSMGAMSLGDNKTHMSENKFYESNPYMRIDYEVYGDFLCDTIERFKEQTKGLVRCYGDCTSNKTSIDFLERSGVDVVITNKVNSLKTKVLLAQARLKNIEENYSQ